MAAGLAAQDGLLTSKPSLIMLLGTDGDRTAARQDFRRSDSILLVRTDPKRHRMSYLSIPRDLRVDIPGQGPNKINAAFQLGGPALTMKTVRALTGLQPNHVVMVDFDNFKEVIDALGGVEIDVPKPILSNRFDCPYATDARCQQWQGWRFEKGKQTMSGKRALIYSRIRENRLDPAENDLTRGERQQAVVEAMTDKLVSPGTFLKLPFVGDDLVKPLTTDLSAGQLLQLGWVRFRANEGRSLHCRLGGEPQSIGGESVLVGGEENSATLAMFTGRSAPQPPPPGTTFGAGCRVGARRLAATRSPPWASSAGSSSGCSRARSRGADARTPVDRLLRHARGRRHRRAARRLPRRGRLRHRRPLRLGPEAVPASPSPARSCCCSG